MSFGIWIHGGGGGGGKKKTFGCKKHTVWLQRVSSSENIIWKKAKTETDKDSLFLNSTDSMTK